LTTRGDVFVPLQLLLRHTVASRRSPTCRRARLVRVRMCTRLCICVCVCLCVCVCARVCVVVSYYDYRVVPLHTTTRGRLITLLYIIFVAAAPSEFTLYTAFPPTTVRGSRCECVRCVSSAVAPPPTPPMCNTEARARAHTHRYAVHAGTHSFYPPPPAASRCTRYNTYRMERILYYYNNVHFYIILYTYYYYYSTLTRALPYVILFFGIFPPPTRPCSRISLRYA